ncbi:hypothetical protein [Mycolicibacterium mucogenicum]|uniref:ParB/Sulfiredoxin domain-containing protein n=1 Tax=Mycolicibacterium mucogenicum DSM 44124 TaxID=1226753 RepID=A0A8H2PJ35_MYCMU|nr:hypothetical protein [Mycolicibacterium mucogenicum]KAB7755182.1 hypothetical protein MMUC44124_20535 [Mycolicibacterium mucogenicum DSM 44124]QPG68858.1 hypothetical protein C1S78_026150 [Mycolicibacterium mucogenicum DSM 44124]
MADRWPIIDVKLDELALDIQNVRIPEKDLAETAIVNYLVEAEDLLDLARDILRDGYIDNEMPVVTREDGKLVVLEGNRRVASLKAIQNPGLVGKSEPQLQRHLTRYPDADMPTVIRVQVAPSREVAQPLLARLHTGDPKKAWLREQQAVFYHSQLSDSVTIDDLRTTYPREAGKIVSFIRMGEMRELIRSIPYVDPALEDFVKNSKLKMSSLEYAYDRPKIREVLGLEFRDNGTLKSKRLSPAHRAGLIYLLQQFKDGVLNTRSPQLKERCRDEHIAFVDELRGVVEGASGSPSGDSSASSSTPGTGSPGSATASGGTNGSAASGRGGGNGNGGTAGGSQSGGAAAASTSGAGAAGGATTRGPNRGSALVKLDFSGFVYKGSRSGLRRRIEELRTINVKDFPNAAYDLMRTILECAIKEYFNAQGKPLDGKLTLGPSVTQLASEFKSDKSMTSLINAINRSGKMPTSQYSGTTESLNASNHNPDSFAERVEVHEAWDRIKPILTRLVG